MIMIYSKLLALPHQDDMLIPPGSCPTPLLHPHAVTGSANLEDAKVVDEISKWQEIEA